GRVATGLQLRHLLREPLGAILRELLELRLEPGDPLGGAPVAGVLLPLGGQRREQGTAAGGTLGQRGDRLARGFEPHPDPLLRGARGVEAVAERLALAAAGAR